jgi:hypothetical protein
MQVTHVKVSFSREKQPLDKMDTFDKSEKSTPFVEYAAVLESGEDHLSITKSLLSDAITSVYSGLGMDVPGVVLEKMNTVLPIKLSSDNLKEEISAPPKEEEKPKRNLRSLVKSLISKLTLRIG